MQLFQKYSLMTLLQSELFSFYVDDIQHPLVNNYICIHTFFKGTPKFVRYRGCVYVHSFLQFRFYNCLRNKFEFSETTQKCSPLTSLLLWLHLNISGEGNAEVKLKKLVVNVSEADFTDIPNSNFLYVYKSLKP